MSIGPLSGAQGPPGDLSAYAGLALSLFEPRRRVQGRLFRTLMNDAGEHVIEELIE